MLQYKNYVPEGVADTHWDEYETKDRIMGQIKKHFKNFGYRQIMTPTFEYYDLFAGIDGTIHRDEMFKFIDGNGKILVLRPDVTIPIARMAANGFEASKGYLKFSYVSNVFRVSEEQCGNKREFMQAGIEYLGNEKADADAEVVAVGIKIILDCGIKNFQFDLGQAAFFKGLMMEVAVERPIKDQIRKLIEQKNTSELAHFLKPLNIPSRVKETILKIPYLYGKAAEVIVEARRIALNIEMEKAIKYLEEVYEILKDYGYEQYITVDLGLVNHMDYYTGVIFKGYVQNYGKPLLSGGRYDNLTKKYGTALPATGFGLNIDELMEVMEMNNMLKGSTCFTDFLILYTKKTREKAIALAETLRNKGFIVESDLYEQDIKNQIENAEFRNIKEIVQLLEENLKIINIRNNEIRKNSLAQFLKNIENSGAVFSIH
ncbi:ATP phosphoribosyltransferase regulatory subunit [Geosporobacter ferrireducens]|uniref:ATP phosphoribosyltransferase regulatory subunit n=1 Tax=Geosporobacter ferrireducens TaxID=1424294 RepID=A0A1D8GNZ4_9FIRM|nr:ATP phosphoribosyltransferase regulatory subunit [Geosporobacter ferrireducens]AOT72669.1 ATP phosphoribosyltransferase regulatory subunit [Geosporobacter ferrireducens]MTI55076.1 ATP phosphoribosyltransferase regulatory subunit [Geosporobacter ferrireducens]